MRECSSSVSGSACARQRTGIRERLLSGSKGPITMFSSMNDGILLFGSLLKEGLYRIQILCRQYPCSGLTPPGNNS